MALEVSIGGDGTLFVGEDKVLDLEVIDDAGNPKNIGGWTIAFVVRLKDDSDAALIDVVATIVGTFDADRDTNTQRARVVLDDDMTNLLEARPYRHSWKRMDAGAETVLAYGSFTPQLPTVR